MVTLERHVVGHLSRCRSSRSVVERRQQIGALRLIGFRRNMVEAIFLLESAFVALTSILVGTLLGIIVGHNVIADSERQGSSLDRHQQAVVFQALLTDCGDNYNSLFHVLSLRHWHQLVK